MKSANKSARYMTRQEVATHYCVDKTTIRRPGPNSPFACLRQIRVGRRVLYLRSDVAALDRRLEKAAMTPYGERGAPVAPDHDYTGDEERAS